MRLKNESEGVVRRCGDVEIDDAHELPGFNQGLGREVLGCGHGGQHRLSVIERNALDFDYSYKVIETVPFDHGSCAECVWVFCRGDAADAQRPPQ